MRLKTNELKDLQQELTDHKQRSEEHIHDLSTKLKTVTDRHREATALLNSDIKAKKQQIEQYTQQIEQIITEKVQFENERGELQRQVILFRWKPTVTILPLWRQCRVKDSINTDLETQIRNLQRELTAANYPVLPIQPVESTVPKVDYDKLDQELQSTRKRLDITAMEVRTDSSRVKSIDRHVLISSWKRRMHWATDSNKIFARWNGSTMNNWTIMYTRARPMRNNCTPKFEPWNAHAKKKKIRLVNVFFHHVHSEECPPVQGQSKCRWRSSILSRFSCHFEQWKKLCSFQALLSSLLT